MQRRRVLKLGVVSATAIGILASVSWVLQPVQMQRKAVSSAGLKVLVAVSAGLLEGSIPTERKARAAAMSSYLDRLADTVSGLPSSSQRDLAQVLSLLSQAPGRRVLSGLGTHWTEASQEAIRDALETMRASRWALRRQVYHALRDLARAAWFADPMTWGALGYAGPLAIA